MKLDSHWFEKVRIPSRGAGRPGTTEEAGPPRCDHPGCTSAGLHRAPKGRDNEGQYFNFCVDHVRAYNQTYDYFRGMSDEAMADYQRSASIGHRPTWKIGVNGAPQTGDARRNGDPDHVDPFDLFAQQPRRRSRKTAPPPETARPLKNMERQSLEALDLDERATKAEIGARYKQLVKRLHPDANGGDRGSEDKLRAIIQAYKYLRQSGLA